MTPFLKLDIKTCEGWRSRAYPDPETGGAPWTIGWGHTGLEVHPGMEITEAEGEAYLDKDIAHAVSLCDRYMPWWRSMNDPRQDVMVQLVFNMGWGDGTHGLSSFKHALAAAKAGDYYHEGIELLGSHWAKEVKSRADRLVKQVQTGIRQAS